MKSLAEALVGVFLIAGLGVSILAFAWWMIQVIF